MKPKLSSLRHDEQTANWIEVELYAADVLGLNGNKLDVIEKMDIYCMGEKNS